MSAATYPKPPASARSNKHQLREAMASRQDSASLQDYTKLHAAWTSPWLPALVFGFICMVELGCILLLNHGRFVYTLDDPYIHLALAENLARGHYGVNLGEFSAPSSSILWPLLLAPFARLPFGTFVPLAFNLLASLGSLALVCRVVDRALAGSPPKNRRTTVWLTAIFFVFAANLVGLTFTGMEHALQVFLALVVVAGLIEERETDEVAWWLAAGIVLGPLVRYENLALSLPALLYLVGRRHFRIALVVGGCLALTLGGFSLFLDNLGLGWLPSSVLAKSDVASSGGALALIENLKANLATERGVLLSLLLLLSFGRVMVGRSPRDVNLATWISLVLVGHLLAGRFGWFHRYELYAWAAALLMLLYLFRRSFARLLLHAPPARLAWVYVFFLLIVCRPYLEPVIQTPLAANNIYEQQFQMHRFVEEYHDGPVAVNDLGWVAYRNDRYVLDLWGLASHEALSLRKSRQDSQWMDELTASRGVKLAMVYAGWFRTLPASWQPVADLYLGRRRITPARHVVTFYALDTTAEARLRPQLEAFRQTLPPGVTLNLRDAASP